MKRILKMSYNQPRVRRNAQSPFKFFGNRMTYQQRHYAQRYVLSNMISDIPMSEYLALTAICHRTISYGKYFEAIPQKHILKGVISNYEMQSGAYKISRQAHSNALLSLARQGKIVVLHHPSKPWFPKFYGVNMLFTNEVNEESAEFWGCIFTSHRYHGLDVYDTSWFDSNINRLRLDELVNDEYLDQVELNSIIKEQEMLSNGDY